MLQTRHQNQNQQQKQMPMTLQLIIPAITQPLWTQVDGIKILEGLAASGLRSIRYAMEVEGTGRVDANDLDADVVDAMKRNILFNGEEAAQRLRPLQGDARVIMLQSPLVSPFCSQGHPARHVQDRARLLHHWHCQMTTSCSCMTSTRTIALTCCEQLHDQVRSGN